MEDDAVHGLWLQIVDGFSVFLGVLDFRPGALADITADTADL